MSDPVPPAVAATQRSRGPTSSLRVRWTATLLVIGAAPIVLLALQTTRILRDALKGSEQQLQTSIVDHASQLLQDTLENGGDGAHRIGRILSDKRIADEDAKIDLAKEAMIEVAVLAQVAIYKTDGELLDALGPEPKPADKLPYAKSVLESASETGRWLAPEYAGKQAWIRYLDPIIVSGKQTGWILATLKPKVIDDELRTMSRDRFEGRTDGVLWVDDTLTIMGGGDGAELGIGASIASKDLFTTLALKPADFRKQTGGSLEFTSAKGEAMFGSYRVPGVYPSAIVVRRPLSSVFASLKAARTTLAGVAGGFIALAILTGTWLAARTVRPIRALVDLSRAYGKREFSRRSDVKTNDELQELGASMSEMADSISASDKEIQRRITVESDLSRYLPGEVAKAIASGDKRLALGGRRQRVTVLFADVASFTAFAEKAPPEQVVALLNELFTVMTEVVFRHGGTVDKFIGDCVMALFGARVGDDEPAQEESDHAERALLAAEDMHRFVEASAETWKAKYGTTVRLAIGVATGDAVVGNLGSEQRMEFTAVGDTVNIA
ncbi:MAG: adenylate/guanylate cyclase domain-containing protein, partial [Polyangiales bacterium]